MGVMADGGCQCFFFFFFFLIIAAIWVDLMVVVGCGLWEVTVAVGYGGDGRWWLSVSLMIMGWDNILF